MRPSRNDRSWMTYLAFCALLAVAILGLFFPIQGNGGGGGGGGGGDNEIPPRYLLVLDDNTTQSLGVVNQWKNILFHHQKVSSPAFFYPDSPPWDYVRSLVPGYYRVYLSIQTETPPTTMNTSYHCRACHLTYAIRAIQQFGGIGPLYDIGDSFTTIARDVSFLSKEFIMLVNNGDIIRFQFKSLCPDMVLAPLPTTATLIISSI